eukprot:scaffold1041_cov121-Cylindrotheca_fusiformis.AAC.2
MRIFSVLAVVVPVAAFIDDPIKIFGIPRGGGFSKKGDAPPPTISKDDYERAQKEIFDAIKRLEGNVERVVEKEVDTLFQDLENHKKKDIKEEAMKVVKKGTTKVKKSVEDHDHSREGTLPSLHDPHHYPYDWPHEDPDHRILHAIEAAEKAVLHAVNDEVMNLFHESDGSNSNNNEAKRAQEVLKEGVLKANKHLNDSHEHRRSWFTSETEGELRNIEEYMKFVWTI